MKPQSIHDFIVWYLWAAVVAIMIFAFFGYSIGKDLAIKENSRVIQNGEVL